MNIIDIIILVPIAYGLIRGLFRGLIKELVGIVAIGAAIVCCKLWSVEVSKIIANYFEMSDAHTLQILTYILIGVAAILVVKLIGKILTKILSGIALGGVNRLLGGLFGGAKWLLVVAFIISGLDMIDQRFDIITDSVKTESRFYEPIKHIAQISSEKLQQLDVYAPNKSLENSTEDAIEEDNTKHNI